MKHWMDAIKNYYAYKIGTKYALKHKEAVSAYR